MMTKRIYLKRLRRALRGVSERDREKLIDYYAELIDEAYEHGKTSKEVFSELDSPEEAAEIYLRETKGEKGGYREAEEDFDFDEDFEEPSRRPVKRKRHSDWEEEKPKKKSSFLGTVLLPLRIVLVFVAVVLGIVAFSVLIAFFATGIGLWIAGVAVFVASFGPLFHGHFVVAIAQFGTAIALCGVGTLMMACAPLLWNLNSVIWRFALGRPQKNDPVKKSTLRGIAAGLATLAVGGIVFTVTFGVNGFRAEALAVTGDIIRKEETVEYDEIPLSFKADNCDLEVVVSEEDAYPRVVYCELQESPREFSVTTRENGAAIELKESKRNGGWSWFTYSWERGVYFTLVVRDYHKTTLYLPASYDLPLSLDISNGTVAVKELTLDVLTVNTANGAVEIADCTLNALYAKTQNGAVHIDRVRAHDISAETDNGEIALYKCSAENELVCKVDNGAILFRDIEATHISATASVGSISGKIIGKKSEYKIQAKVDLGSCNLTDQPASGEKSARFEVSVGSVQVTFSA